MLGHFLYILQMASNCRGLYTRINEEVNPRNNSLWKRGDSVKLKKAIEEENRDTNKKKNKKQKSNDDSSKNASSGRRIIISKSSQVEGDDGFWWRSI